MSRKTKKMIEEFKGKLAEKGIDVSEFDTYFKEIENNLKDKKYGLVWENHTEEIEKELLTKFPILKEEKELRIHNKSEEGLTNNFLIEGDNLESLTALKNMGKKVDVIYIDPPYNLGGKEGFKYEDDYVDKEDRYRHSKWLSFMEARLEIARDLLTDKGVVYVSIDGSENSNLTHLMDKIFGEVNRLDVISVVNNLKGRSDSRFFATSHEFMNVYAKDREKAEIRGFDPGEDYFKEFKFEDEKGKYKRVGLKKTGKGAMREDRPNMYYGIYYDEESGEISLRKGEGFVEIYPKLGGKDGRWRWGRERFEELKGTELEIVKNSKGEYVVYVKMRESVGGKKREIRPKSVWGGPGYDTSNGGDALNNILGKNRFNSPKPLKLIKDVVRTQDFDGDGKTVLDFFAGSGTTGHAVLEYNKENGTNHNFILCTNNENNICKDVTYQRLNKVINGYTTPKGKEVEGIPSNLTYLKTELVEKEDDFIDFEVSEELLESMINNLKVLYNITKEEKLGENLVKLENDDKEMYLYTNFYIESEDFEGIELDSNKTNVVYVKEENLTDVVLNMFDEVISLEDLVRF